LVGADGRESRLNSQPVAENTEVPPQAGADYYGGPVKIGGVVYLDAIPVQPALRKNPVFIRFSLADKTAVRFKATLGADYPFGNESERRRVFASRVKGTEARFLTIIEPYETKAMVASAEATGPDSLRVELADGRVQEIQIQHLASTKNDVAVSITERQDGKVTRTETTSKSDGH